MFYCMFSLLPLFNLKNLLVNFSVLLSNDALHGSRDEETSKGISQTQSSLFRIELVEKDAGYAASIM